MGFTESLNFFLDSIASGDIAVSFSFSQIKAISSLLGPAIILMVIIMILGQLRKGHSLFVHPHISFNEITAIITHTINDELVEIYRNKSEELSMLIPKTFFRGEEPGRGYILPENIVWRAQAHSFFFDRVDDYRLSVPDRVKKGDFSGCKVLLNQKYFESRVLQTRYARIIAAKLFFFQVYALRGLDPRKIQSNDKMTDSAAEHILNIAGRRVSHLSSPVFFDSFRSDRRIDEGIGDLLRRSEANLDQEKRKTGEILRSMVQNIGTHLSTGEFNQFEHLLEEEIKHLEHLAIKMNAKKKSVESLIEATKDIKDEENIKRAAYLRWWLNEWNERIIKVQHLSLWLKHILGAKSRWSFYPQTHFWTRGQKSTDISDTLSAFAAEAAKDKINITKIQAILTSFKATEAYILQLMEGEERVI
jgi:hypothetical protein